MSLEIISRKFEGPRREGPFHFYKFGRGNYEIWFGKRYISINMSWGK